MTLFLLTVFGLLLGAGIKGKMQKAGLDTTLAWDTGRKWWEVTISAIDSISHSRIDRFCLTGVAASAASRRNKSRGEEHEAIPSPFSRS